MISSAHLVNDLYMMILPPLLPMLILAFNLSYLMAGTLTSFILLISSIMSLVFGYLADSRNRKKPILVLGFILFGLSLLVLSSAINFPWLLLACAVLGLAKASYHPQAVSFINFFIKRGKGRALGIHGIGGGLGHFAAPILVGYLVVMMGWRASLLVLFAPPIVMAVFLWRILREPAIPSVKGFIKGITIPLLLLTLVQSMIDMIYRGFAYFLPSYFVFEGYDLFQAGTLMALMLASGMIAQPLGGGLSDKIGRGRVFNISLLLLTISLLGFSVTKGVASLIFLPLIGLGVFSTFPVALIYAPELVGSERTGTSVGFMSGTSQIIGSAFPILIGYVIDSWGFTASFYLLVIFAGLAFAVSTTIPKAR